MMEKEEIKKSNFPIEKNDEPMEINEMEYNYHQQRIFKNLEPDFTDHTGELPLALTPDWLSVLLSENRARIERIEQDPDAHAMQRLFINPKTVEYLFTICLRLRQPHEVMYLSLEIYNKFMVEHINFLYTMVRTNEELNSQQKYAQWEKLFSTLSRQVALRALSSIQIASKMHLINLSLSTQMVKDCLRTLGYAYTDESIEKSEIRVLATINWCGNMMQSPVTYLETFLHNIFQINPHLEIDTKAIWEYSLMVLDCVFIHSDEFYKRISIVAHGRQGKHAPRMRLNQLKADYVLLSAGVICTACICVHGTDFIHTVIITLQQTTGIPSESISDVYMGIYQTIHDHQIDNPLDYSIQNKNKTPPPQPQSTTNLLEVQKGPKRRKTVTFSDDLKQQYD